MDSSMRSSVSSYGDPRYLSTMTASDAPAPVAPLGKSLVDGYRDSLDPQHDDRSRYNPLNTAHPRSSALLNANDPVALYLLTETAIGDSINYEVLSFEEVENLKKEASVLSSRIVGTRRKLALETKLRDAAQSLGRLYSPPSPRSSGEYAGNTHRRSRSIFGRSGTSEALDKSDSELAVSQRRCEQLAQELWRLEGRSQKINQRLLEHTAGVLQMTHKGLKKGPKNAALDNAYDEHEFDDRSLYRTNEHLDQFGVHGKVQSGFAPANTEAMQAMERRLEDISERMHDMMIQSNPGEFIDPPSAANGIETIALHKETVRSAPGASEVAPEAEGAWKFQITEINNRVQTIGLEEQLAYLRTGVDGLESRVDGVLEQKSILTTQIQQQRELNSKSDAERDAHIGDLTEKLTNVRRDLEVSEREANASRDELALVMEQLEAMRHSGSSQEESKAALVQAEGEVARLQSVLTSLHSEADARAIEVSEARDAQDHAETELKRLHAHLESLQRDHDTRAVEVSDARDRAEGEAKQLQTELETLRNATDSKSEEAKEAREHAESEVQRLEAVIVTMQYEADSRSEEAREARELAQEEVQRLHLDIETLRNDTGSQSEASKVALDRAEGEVQRLEAVIVSMQGETDSRSAEAREAQDHAESEVQRLEAVIATMQHESDSQSTQVREARDHAESEVQRLEAVIVTMQHESEARSKEIKEARDDAEDEVKRLQTVIESLQTNNSANEELKEAHSRAESEIQRLQGIIDTTQNDAGTRSEEIIGARDRAEQEVAQLEAAIQKIRSQSETRIQEADNQRAQSDETVARLQNEMTELEGEIVRVTTELTMVKAELDGAYGTRAQRAAEVTADPSIQRENDALVTRNIELTEELAIIKSQRGGGDLQQRADTLERELRETIDDYEAMTKASIEFEKERERFEGFIDSLRDRCEQLETQLAEERISWMNLSSPTSVGRDGASETTSTMVLKNEFKKMMRDTRNENMKILRVSFDFPPRLTVH
ncbi:uncharacterized protein N7506_011539 [Penicillium brevicompactum]|uniref:uncharacterized protein n=1 Tax=Penicillium brevicompactum TaxID=5074 RepID=UPI0025413600|nr:uncharacterized protein N7506_011539 [Penicillium brevicompactum]KAJ5318835.1 hypothetical protein N7506_011539 [Penicillium brevicompactum]